MSDAHEQAVSTQHITQHIAHADTADSADSAAATAERRLFSARLLVVAQCFGAEQNVFLAELPPIDRLAMATGQTAAAAAEQAAGAT